MSTSVTLPLSVQSSSIEDPSVSEEECILEYQRKALAKSASGKSNDFPYQQSPDQDYQHPAD